MSKAVYYIIFLLLLNSTVTQAKKIPFTKDIWLNETSVPVKVNCLTKDRTGYIWLGTDEGLYRYNGRGFTSIVTKGKAPVTALAAYDDKLLAGFADGNVGVWDGDDFRVKQLTGATPGEAISSIHVVCSNMFVLATLGAGLYMVLNNHCTRYGMGSGLSDDYLYTIVSPEKNILLAATDQGINEIINKEGKVTVKNYTTSAGLPDNIVRVIKPMSGKCWSWIGTHQAGLALYCSKNLEVWTPSTKRPWRYGQINDILPIGDDKAWVCTETGYLLKVQLADGDSLDIQDYYYHNQKLYNLLMDETGNIWCATNAGLKLIATEYTSGIKLPAPYSLQSITAIVCDDENVIWFAQKNKLYNFSLSEEVPMPKLIHTATNVITRLYCDTSGMIWAGTFGDGLWCSNNGRSFTKIKGITPLETESILDVVGTGDNLWVAGLNGVEELTVSKANTLSLQRLHNKSTGIGSDYVYKLFPDSKGNMWMATDGAGVCKFRSGDYTHWDSAAGMNSTVAYNITEDYQGRIWASTFDKGAIVYQGERWKTINQENGLLGVNISTIAPTPNGTVLIVHAKGIDEWHADEDMFRHYERRSGMGMDTVSKALNLAATDNAGNVYIPYQSGLICFEKYGYKTSIVPSISIKSVNTFFRKAHAGKYDFAHSENHITFLYDGMNFANPEQLFYRYKLEGFNEEWITTRDESVTFPQLPSGSYRFVVQVSMNSLFTSYGAAVYSFSIANPFWKQIWFIVLMGLLVWAVAYLYIRIREHNLRKLSSLQRERMMFEYEHLKSQVNPHFLFNSLNTLTNLIEDDKETATQYTRQLSDLYRNMLSHKDKDLITVAEELDIIDNYVFVQKSRFGSALQLKINIPDKIQKTKKIVPMALQLLLENAMKHNVVSKTKPLIVRFDIIGDQLVVSNNLQPKVSKERGAGLGLTNIHKRYLLHTKMHVSWKIENNEFIVTMPLI